LIYLFFKGAYSLVGNFWYNFKKVSQEKVGFKLGFSSLTDEKEFVKWRRRKGVLGEKYSKCKRTEM
jgi:hypothetical protein